MPGSLVFVHRRGRETIKARGSPEIGRCTEMAQLTDSIYVFHVTPFK
jgi:hypothetical protein